LPGPTDAGYTGYDINFIDLNLSYGGPFIVQWMDFINAPVWAMELTGNGSSVLVSNFGQGGYGIGPYGGGRPSTETETQSATRHAAIFLDGANNGASYNNIAYTGDGAIDINGSGQYFYGNLVVQSRYEMPNGAGGQVFLSPSSSGASVAGNVIDGTPGYDGVTIADLWHTTSTTVLDTGCSPQSGAEFPGGIEVYGSGHFFYNNEVENNSGGGMQLAGSNPTSDITISSWNGENPSDTTPRYIEYNGYDGIQFLGPYALSADCTVSGGGPGYLDSHSVCQPIYAAQGVTLDNVLVRRNNGYGVRLDGVSNDVLHTNPIFGGNYNGFINNACINDGNNVETAYGAIPLDPTNPPANPTPASDALWYQRTTAPYNTANYGQNSSCPASSGPAEPTPARSNIPGWRW
jgi:hypothetical protein